MHTVGRLVTDANCPHRHGWTSSNGEERCNACGTRRFTGYGALRPPELPSAARPSDEDAVRVDRAAATVIARTVRHLSRWGLNDSALWLAV